ncbi:MAG: membrane protein insertion efficiency factor YidD [Saprospiraceae bacterium]|uniref:Putative membrane protein insertion efficiency factor n=1 Tax=Candidatus Defluviibacterium haderslevense TaxID=2981993 RepID=A0A9D7S716_9BACT|nr:membrane protein insertion efficiency factor YidD [Candidatus Defluviibacterium haderslevense]MBL0238910.1 membrane protein insertion efficiency factor YidD [Candidatus Defluviibacterium haderslevense]
MKWFNYIIIFPIRVYQIFISPILGKNCRFNPTCSNYMIQAVNEWGIFYGFYLGIRRITKCHPWGGTGDDPIPKKKK